MGFRIILQTLERWCIMTSMKRIRKSGYWLRKRERERERGSKEGRLERFVNKAREKIKGPCHVARCAVLVALVPRVYEEQCLG